MSRRPRVSMSLARAQPKETVNEGPKQEPKPTEDELRQRQLVGFPAEVNVGGLVVGVRGYHTTMDVPTAAVMFLELVVAA